ncbi:MAG: lysylphosphatidylglycerol synthase transmembrane domain-containing protein [Anaerolineales bacterium]
MRKLIIVIVLFLTVTLVTFRFSELQEVILTLQQANAWFVGLAILIQGGWFLALGLMFQSIYRMLGLRESMERLTQLVAAGCFVGVIAPSAGFGGLAIFMADGHDRGHPSGKVTVAGALYALLDQAAFLCVLAIGIIILIRRNHLDAAEVGASLILLASAAFIAFLLYLAYRSPLALAEVLARLARVINTILRPILRRAYLSEERAHTFAADVSAGLSSVPANPANLIRPFGLALASKALLMGVLMCSFLSFGIPFTAGMIVGGFAIAYLFVIVSPTPSGVGVVEGLMAVGLKTLGVDFSQAVVITLMYRGITFWLPLAVGAGALRSLHLGSTRTSQANT